MFTLADLRNATKNFKAEYVLGEGGFGKVFKGWVDEKTLNPAKSGVGMIVAVKKLNHDGMQGFEEWQVSDGLILIRIRVLVAPFFMAGFSQFSFLCSLKLIFWEDFLILIWSSCSVIAWRKEIFSLFMSSCQKEASKTTFSEVRINTLRIMLLDY